METTQDSQKILLVGTERNCRSIGYVLGFENYELIEKLTAEAYEKYHDYPIYVCELKRKSKKLVDKKLYKSANKIQYLDDVCRLVDEKCIATQCYQKTLKPVKHEKHKIFKVWSQFIAAYNARHYCYRRINKYYREFLCNLTPSELLLYVLNAPVNPHVRCSNIETTVMIKTNGNLGSCGCFISFGNLIQNGEIADIYNSVYARIVKLSSLNNSYCLCDVLNKACKGYGVDKNNDEPKQFKTEQIPNKFLIGIDATCNLCCKSCRNKPRVMKEDAKNNAELMTQKILRSGWLTEVGSCIMACNGEVFYSPYYRKLLTENFNKQCKSIDIMSNGMLFNETNWELLSKNYSQIHAVSISVDAATAETYEDLRVGGKWNVLLKNLNMLSELHRQKKFEWFQLNFVVQRANLQEMCDFVRLGQKLGVNKVNFQNMHRPYFLTKNEFKKICLVNNHKYLDYELWKVLQDPIFNDPIVDLKGLQRYIDASEKKYRKRYEREQRVKQK